MKRVGVCATDLHLLDGHIGDPFPLVPGHEFVGEVAAIAPAAAIDRRLAVGDRIAVEMVLPCGMCPRCREGRYNLCETDDPAAASDSGRQYGINIPRTRAPGLWGGYADVLAVPAQAIVHRVPDSIPWDTATLIEPFAVAFRAIDRGRVSPGDRVVVIGPGPVGLLVAAAVRLAGAARVVMVGTRLSRLVTAERFGADVTLDTRVEGGLGSAVRESLGALADVVIEAAGAAAAQREATTLVRRGGRVVLAGACGSEAVLELRPDEQLLTREIDLLPSFLSAGGYEPSIAALARGQFPYDELITHRFPLDRAESAIALVRSKEENVMKTILVPHE